MTCIRLCISVNIFALAFVVLHNKKFQKTLTFGVTFCFYHWVKRQVKTGRGVGERGKVRLGQLTGNAS